MCGVCAVATPKRRGVRVDSITWYEDGEVVWSRFHSETIIRACRFLPLTFPYVAETTENIDWIYKNPSLFTAFQSIVADNDLPQNDVAGTVFFGGKNTIYMDAIIPIYQMLSTLVQAIDSLEEERQKEKCYMTLRRACRKASKNFGVFSADQALRQSIGTILTAELT